MGLLWNENMKGPAVLRKESTSGWCDVAPSEVELPLPPWRYFSQEHFAIKKKKKTHPEMFYYSCKCYKNVHNWSTISHVVFINDIVWVLYYRELHLWLWNVCESLNHCIVSGIIEHSLTRHNSLKKSTDNVPHWKIGCYSFTCD